MDLKIKDVADLLNVSETTIRRWLAEGKIPAYRINHQYRFSRTEIEDWVLSHKLGQAGGAVPFAVKTQDSGQEVVSSGQNLYSLYRAINKGMVLCNVQGTTKEEVIRETTRQVAQELHLDADVLADLLLDRETLQPTALNNGIGVPHTRDFLLNAHYDVVTIAFPKEPIAYGALDGLPAHTLFFLFASEDKKHLHLLAKIAHLCSNKEALVFLQSKPSKEKLLEFVKEWEGTLSQTPLSTV